MPRAAITKIQGSRYDDKDRFARIVKYVVVHGLGSKRAFMKMSEGSFSVLRTAAAKRCSNVLLFMPRAGERITSRAAAEGAVLGCYAFDKYLSQEEDEKLISPDCLYVTGADQDGLFEGRILAEAQCYTRDIANEPGNVITPAALAEKALSLAEEFGLKCEIWNEERSSKKMGAFYAVARVLPTRQGS